MTRCSTPASTVLATSQPPRVPTAWPESTMYSQVHAQASSKAMPMRSPRFSLTHKETVLSQLPRIRRVEFGLQIQVTRCSAWARNLERVTKMKSSHVPLTMKATPLSQGPKIIRAESGKMLQLTHGITSSKIKHQDSSDWRSLNTFLFLKST